MLAADLRAQRVKKLSVRLRQGKEGCGVVERETGKGIRGIAEIE